MPTTNQRVQVYRGEAVSVDFQLSPVVDVTGWTTQFTADPDLDTAPPKLIQQSGVVTDGPGGKVRVSLSATQTNVAVGQYEFDLWRVDAGEERPLALGSFEVLPSVRVPTA